MKKILKLLAGIFLIGQISAMDKAVIDKPKRKANLITDNKSLESEDKNKKSRIDKILLLDMPNELILKILNHVASGIVYGSSEIDRAFHDSVESILNMIIVCQQFNIFKTDLFKMMASYLNDKFGHRYYLLQINNNLENQHLISQAIKSGIDYNIPSDHPNQSLLDGIIKRDFTHLIKLIKFYESNNIFPKKNESAIDIKCDPLISNYNLKRNLGFASINENQFINFINNMILYYKNANINHIYTNSELPLLIDAIVKNNINIARFLINNGINVNNLYYNYDCSTALTAACKRGNKGIVELLINKGADVNQKGCSFAPPLIDAIVRSNIGISRLLLNHKDININIRDEHGSTPLIHAAGNGLICITELLVKLGADINAKNLDNNTALLISLLKDKTHISIFLINNFKDIDFNICSRNLGTALILAICKNYVNIVRAILSKNVNVNQQNINGSTALKFTVRNNKNNEALKLLLNHSDIDVNIQDIYGFTALMYAVIENNKEAVELLIKSGAAVNLKCNEGKTALDMSTENKEIEELLINNSRD